MRHDFAVVVVVLVLCAMSSLAFVEAAVRSNRRSATGSNSGLKNTADSLEQTFNKMIISSERLQNRFGKDKAAINQARSAFLLCPMCPYSGPQLEFLREMFSVDELVDRRYIMDSIFPALINTTAAASYLWVGVKAYTMRYEYILEEAGASRFDTIEPDSSQAMYGSSQHHYVDIGQNIGKYIPASTYDVVIANGVLGWGINTPEERSDFFTATARVMKSGGILVLGFNPHIGSDHTLGFDGYFERTRFGGLPEQVQFDAGWKHKFEFFQRNLLQA